MNTNENLYSSSTNELIKNFSEMIINFGQREKNWETTKKSYEKKIEELLKKKNIQENINIDLLKRVKLLEYELYRLKESKKNKKVKNEIIFKDSKYKNIIKDDIISYIDNFNSSSKSSFKNILKNIGINERLANNLFVDFELNKPELETLIKKDIEQKFLQEDDIISNINSKLDPSENYNFKFTKFAELKSHFDEVRNLVYMEKINSLISVSEDCSIKVWSMENIMYNNQNEDITPYLNLQGHTGPIYCATQGIDNILFTSGKESLIRIWNILPHNEINSLQTNEEINKLNLGYFQDNDDKEIYWNLKHHQKENLLISLSSSGKITFWETGDYEHLTQDFNQGKMNRYKFHKYKKSSYLNEENAIPTCCEFMPQDNNKLLIGFNDVTLSLLDLNKNSFISNYNLFNNSNYKKNTNNRNINHSFYQINCISCYNSIPCAFTGFEDGFIKLLDFRNNITSNIINNIYSKENISESIKAHNDAITSLNIYKDLYLISTSHDENIKLWDIRKLNKCIDVISTKQKKWDESILDSVLIPNQLTLCVACADSSVKLYKL